MQQPTPANPVRYHCVRWALLCLMALILTAVAVGWAKGVMNGPQNALNNDSLPYYRDASLRPRWDRWASWHHTARFSLTGDRGQIVDQNTLEKKPTVVGFFYGGCISVCPVSLEALRKLNDALGKTHGAAAPQFLLISATPDDDTPKTLAAYAQRLHLPTDWILATGKSSEVHGLASSLMSDVRRPAGGGEPPHLQRAFLLDMQRRIRGVYDAGSMTEMRRMANDYQRLVSEHARGMASRG